jgi:hypothetical protein
VNSNTKGRKARTTNAQSNRNPNPSRKPKKAKPETSPDRESTWSQIDGPIWDQLFEELYESAAAAEVGDLGPLQVPMERIADRLSNRFLQEAQALFMRYLIEAATIAQSHESILAAAATTLATYRVVMCFKDDPSRSEHLWQGEAMSEDEAFRVASLEIRAWLLRHRGTSILDHSLKAERVTS